MIDWFSFYQRREAMETPIRAMDEFDVFMVYNVYVILLEISRDQYMVLGEKRNCNIWDIATDGKFYVLKLYSFNIFHVKCKYSTM